VRLAAACLLLFSHSARAACPAGTTPEDSTLYQDCGNSQPVGVTQTTCTDQNGGCVSQSLTVGARQFPCMSCSDCTAGQNAASQYASGMCGPRINCGDGTCGGGEKCCSGKCVPGDATCCGDGYCENAACGNGKCCPDGLSMFDKNSGYCCGSLLDKPATCDCATPCDSGCCPAGSVCCGGGWCAPSANDCPHCTPGLTTFCPDGTCAPPSAICCGQGYYCPNGRACINQGAGQFACDGNLIAAKTSLPIGANSGMYTAQQPMLQPSPGTDPEFSPLNPKRLPGCNCQLSSSPISPPSVLISVLFFSALLLRRRRAR
jgi:hypothetical protein